MKVSHYCMVLCASILTGSTIKPLKHCCWRIEINQYSITYSCAPISITPVPRKKLHAFAYKFYAYENERDTNGHTSSAILRTKISGRRGIQLLPPLPVGATRRDTTFRSSEWPDGKSRKLRINVEWALVSLMGIKFVWDVRYRRHMCAPARDRSRIYNDELIVTIIIPAIGIRAFAAVWLMTRPRI